MTPEIIRTGNATRTKGLVELGHPELLATVDHPDLAFEAEAFLRYVIDYLMTHNATLTHGQTLMYGYWLTKFIKRGDILETWEYKADATEFVPGVTLAATYWRDQHRTCTRLRADFNPPRPDRLVVISAGVLEGDSDVQGVRYPSPEHMSGWWLTTSRFDGNIETLRTTHAYHVTAARSDLAHLIALPCGFRFDLSPSESIWFDEKVAAEKP